MSISSIEDTPSKTITKSSHQRRKTLVEIEKEKLRAAITGATIDKNSKESREGCEINLTSGKAEKVKKLSTRGKAKNESHEGCDIKREYESLTRSQDGYDLKGRPSFSLAMSGGRRRSFCNPQTKLADFFSCNGVRVVSVDMPPFMQVHAVDSARKTHDSLEKFTAKTLASSLKREFDGVYGPAWHCIVGSSFGSFVTHSAGGFLYFSMDHKLYILLFKTAVQRAD